MDKSRMSAEDLAALAVKLLKSLESKGLAATLVVTSRESTAVAMTFPKWSSVRLKHSQPVVTPDNPLDPEHKDTCGLMNSWTDLFPKLVTYTDSLYATTRDAVAPKTEDLCDVIPITRH